ncbi:hypothetical protein Y032_0294g1645 [Ancylostoma ceylanicum]|uniref:Uncharacterized protein n=1 Tax=Ancylostoma ceylanicum TaxID=53326 RepID=A0A016S4T0_9BILA|nr:hypothetical protein Y032_0294g1645 [Ancylostoma ceylanicum]
MITTLHISDEAVGSNILLVFFIEVSRIAPLFKMFIEIEETVCFIASFLYGKIPRRYRASETMSMSLSLSMSLVVGVPFLGAQFGELFTFFMFYNEK